MRVPLFPAAPPCLRALNWVYHFSEVIESFRWIPLGQPERSSGAGGGHHRLSFTRVFLLQPHLSPAEGPSEVFPGLNALVRYSCACLIIPMFLEIIFVRWDSPLKRNNAVHDLAKLALNYMLSQICSRILDTADLLLRLVKILEKLRLLCLVLQTQLSTIWGTRPLIDARTIFYFRGFVSYRNRRSVLDLITDVHTFLFNYHQSLVNQ